ncbi:protein of unknown function [Candidatus Bipolaricaulis anaerobius]|uniref:Uncharacterized protein n=1 Tax=Candidatus Bipolaricaulis anaerobius TaxID=2026885 RepID=A0A2X3K6T4_9BACT|nr:protein of unknown function [Candidatus Bipolaricaulis anaerobius]
MDIAVRVFGRLKLALEHPASKPNTARAPTSTTHSLIRFFVMVLLPLRSMPRAHVNVAYRCGDSISESGEPLLGAARRGFSSLCMVRFPRLL